METIGCYCCQPYNADEELISCINLPYNEDEWKAECESLPIRCAGMFTIQLHHLCV